MCWCCLILPLPPQWIEQHVFWWSRGERASRVVDVVLAKADTGWDGSHPGEKAHPPSQLPMLTTNTLAMPRSLFQRRFSANSNPPCLRLICELSASGGIPEDNDHSLCICLFYTLLHVWQLKCLRIHRIWQRFCQISSELNSLVRCLGNCASIRLGAVVSWAAAWGNHWNSLPHCNQCNARL